MLKPKQNKFKQFISGKGFYAVLALCLVGAGTAAWLSVNKTLGAISNEGVSSISQREETFSSSTAEQHTGGGTQNSIRPNEDKEVTDRWDITDLDPVDKPETNVPISPEPSEQSQSQHTSGSSQQPSSSPSEGSGQQALSPSSQKPAFRLPLSGEIFNQFSDGELVKNETLNEWRTHDGIDIRAAVGSEVTAAAQGEIVTVDQDAIWGYRVEIDHGNGYMTCYYGLDSAIPVNVGDKVMGGDVIGVVGESNAAELAMDSHLHFGVKHNGRWVDPVKTINGQD